MKIILSTTDGNKFAEVNSWEKANEAAKAIFKRQYWSDIVYDIWMTDGTQVSGSIDLEPSCFHKPHQKNIITNHLKTFWTNVSKSSPKPYLTQENIKFCKNLLKYLPQ